MGADLKFFSRQVDRVKCNTIEGCHIQRKLNFTKVAISFKVK